MIKNEKYLKKRIESIIKLIEKLKYYYSLNENTKTQKILIKEYERVVILNLININKEQI